MIVDVHTHFWKKDLDLGPEVERDMRRAGGAPGMLEITPESHRAAIAGADRAVVFGLRASNCGLHVKNDHIAEYVASDPKRLIGFACTDPLVDVPAVDEIKRCVDELGMRGVKLGPTYQGVHPDDERLQPVYAYAERKKLPVLFHQGTTFAYRAPLKFANPVQLEDIAYRHPELKMIVAHMGHPWIGECVSLIRKQPNVYADVSALFYRPYQYYQALKLVEEYGTHHKLLLGSDYPFTTTQQSIDALKKMNDYAAQYHLPPIAREVTDGIIHRDTLAELGLA